MEIIHDLAPKIEKRIAIYNVLRKCWDETFLSKVYRFDDDSNAKESS